MARVISTLALLALVLPTSGSYSRVPDATPAKLFVPLEEEAQKAYRDGRFAEALNLFRSIEEDARKRGATLVEIGGLVNRANCHAVLFQHSEAMSAYLRAKRLAEAIHSPKLVGIQANIAHLHALMGDFTKAVYIAGEALKIAPPGPSREYLLLYLANAHHRLGQLQESDTGFRSAIAEAHGRKAYTEQANALDHYGLALIERGAATAAEPRILEARDLRARHSPRDLPLSERSLGKLRLAQGRASDAIAHLDRAIESQRTSLRMTPIFQLLADRAKAHVMAANRERALADFRSAFGYTRRWRLELLPAGGFQSSWENEVQSLRAAFIQFAAPLAAAENDHGLKVETLIAAEESRLASLRAELALQGNPLPPEHAPKAAELQRLERNLLADPEGAPKLQPRIAAIQVELTEIETQSGLRTGLPSPASDLRQLALDAIRRGDTGEARIGFFLGEPSSWRWELSGGQIELKKLPSRAAIARSVEMYRNRVRSGAELGTGTDQVYNQLFGEISPRSRTVPLWTLALDDRLFELPFAALPASDGAGFLIQQHAIRTTPSLLLPPLPRTNEAVRPFVGVGDPVLNRADSRLGSRPKAAVTAADLQLPRLVSSGNEVDQCAAEWTSPVRVLKGLEASPESLRQALESRPGVVHIATHFLESAGQSHQTFLALGSPQGVELLGPEQIRRMHVPESLIVMSGCQSGGGETRSAGLMGLTRSWLVAGAREVAASYWPTPDESGEIFRLFYRHYGRALAVRELAPAAQALRRAQLDLLNQPGWRSSPRYWAAFFLVSKG